MSACVGLALTMGAAQPEAGAGPTWATVDVMVAGAVTTLTVTVGSSGEVPSGSVTVLDGEAPLAVLPLHDGTASITSTALGPGANHRLTARYAGDVRHAGSVSPPVDVGNASPQVSGSVTVTIPAGALTLTTERPSPGHLPGVTAVRVVVTDTRAGNRGFTLSVAAGDPGATVVLPRAVQVLGNALRAADVRVVPMTVATVGHPRVIAAYPPGLGLGSVFIDARFLAQGRSSTARNVVWTVM